VAAVATYVMQCVEKFGFNFRSRKVRDAAKPQFQKEEYVE
jgi:hypothetical protein